jgi:hypothetical protein
MRWSLDVNLSGIPHFIGLWTSPDGNGAQGGKLIALHPSLVFGELLLRSINKPQVCTDVLLRSLTARSPTAWFVAG